MATHIRRGKATDAIFGAAKTATLTRVSFGLRNKETTSRVPVAEARRVFDENRRVRMFKDGAWYGFTVPSQHGVDSYRLR